MLPINDGTKVYKSYYCPVCKEFLGTEASDVQTTLHCTECKTHFTFFPGIRKPTSQLDSTIPNTCKCPGCCQRRGE